MCSKMSWLSSSQVFQYGSTIEKKKRQALNHEGAEKVGGSPHQISGGSTYQDLMDQHLMGMVDPTSNQLSLFESLGWKKWHRPWVCWRWPRKRPKPKRRPSFTREVFDTEKLRQKCVFYQLGQESSVMFCSNFSPVVPLFFLVDPGIQLFHVRHLRLFWISLTQSGEQGFRSLDRLPFQGLPWCRFRIHLESSSFHSVSQTERHQRCKASTQSHIPLSLWCFQTLQFQVVSPDGSFQSEKIPLLKFQFASSIFAMARHRSSSGVGPLRTLPNKTCWKNHPET